MGRGGGRGLSDAVRHFQATPTLISTHAPNSDRCERSASESIRVPDRTYARAALIPCPRTARRGRSVSYPKLEGSSRVDRSPSPEPLAQSVGVTLHGTYRWVTN